MKTKEFEDFKILLNLNIEVDASLRRITEKIKLIAQRRDPDLLRQVVVQLLNSDNAIDSIIISNVCVSDDECKDE